VRECDIHPAVVVKIQDGEPRGAPGRSVLRVDGVEFPPRGFSKWWADFGRLPAGRDDVDRAIVVVCRSPRLRSFAPVLSSGLSVTSVKVRSPLFATSGCPTFHRTLRSSAPSFRIRLGLFFGL